MREKDQEFYNRIVDLVHAAPASHDTEMSIRVACAAVAISEISEISDRVEGVAVQIDSVFNMLSAINQNMPVGFTDARAGR